MRISNRARNRGHAEGYGRGISHGKNARWMDEEAVPSDHVDPDFDDMTGAELDIREEFAGIARDD